MKRLLEGLLLGGFALLSSIGLTATGGCSSTAAGPPAGSGNTSSSGASAGAGGTNHIGTGGSSVGTGGSGTSPGGSGTLPGGGAAGGGVPGGGGASAGSGGAGVVGSPGGGYVVFGNWHGYAWTGTEMAKVSTITPADFSTVTTNGPLCVKGSVAPTADFSGVGLLGVNINQAGGTDMPLGTVTPTSTGISVKVTNNSPTTKLRVQIQGPPYDATHRWCADVVGSGGFFPWASLTTSCWDAMAPGAAYNKEPIDAVQIVVPGSNAAAIPFDFCLNTLSEGDGTGGVCDPTAAPVTGMTTVWDGGSAVCGADGQQYFIWNNAWGSKGSAQTISWSGTSFNVTAQSASGGGVQGYPSIFIGSINVHKTLGSNLPKQVSALTQVPTSWSWTAAGGEYNAAYDIWFNSSNVTDLNTPSGGFLMIWLHKPGSQNPIGGPSPSQSNVSVGGGTWNIYTGNNGSTPCISYVATSDISTWSGDIAAFVTHAKTVQNGTYMKDSWYLANVFAGFEIWSGGAGLKTNSFSAIVK